MKRRLIIHPFLFAAYPVLAALARNIDSIVPVEAIRPLSVILACAGLLILALRFIVKDWDRAGYLASLIIFLLLDYGYAYQIPRTVSIASISINRHLIVLGLWVLLVGILGSTWIWQRIRPAVITKFLTIVAAISLVFPLRIIVMFLVLVNRDPLTGWTRPVNTDNDTPALAGEYQPDIYYIIVDGYARADVLQEIYHFDNSAFIQFLEEQGFYVASNSQSNYVQTGLSLSSSLNLEYLDYLAFAGGKSANRYPLGDLIAHSRARSLLENIGYKMVTFPSGYLLTDVKDADLYLSANNTRLTEFEGMLLATSAVQIPVELGLLDLPIFGYQTHRQRILYDFDRLAKVPTIDGPKFVFAHIVAPHPPFVFDRNGAPIEPDWAYFIGDGDHFQGTLDNYISGYTGQLAFINSLLIKTIQAILANSKTSPIIIIQADHGPGALLDWNSAANTCLQERFSILNAYYLPDGKTGRLYDDISPVNSFRIVFNTYFGTKLDVLEDKHYFSTWGRPYDFIDVSTKSETQCAAP